MAQDSEKSRYSVTLSPELASLLKDQAKTEEKSLSTFLAQIVEEHYAEKKTLAEYTREMEALRASSEDALQLELAEYESKIIVLRTEKKNRHRLNAKSVHISCNECATSTRNTLRNLSLSMKWRYSKFALSATSKFSRLMQIILLVCSSLHVRMKNLRPLRKSSIII